MLEPRRLAARAAARRMAVERGTPLGDLFGYHVRFDRAGRPATRASWPSRPASCCAAARRPVPGIDRRRRLRRVPRARAGERPGPRHGPARPADTSGPDLQIVVMSATLEPATGGRVPRRLPGRRQRGPGASRSTIRYEPRRRRTTAGRWRPRRPWTGCWTETPGDVLAFLPGVARDPPDGRGPRADVAGDDVAVLPLHGDLPPEQQDRRCVAAGPAEGGAGDERGRDVGHGRGRHRRRGHRAGPAADLRPAVGLDRLELCRSRAPPPTSGPAGPGGRSPACASGCGARRPPRAAGADRAGDPPRRPGRGGAAAARASAKRTSSTSRGSTRRTSTRRRPGARRCSTARRRSTDGGARPTSGRSLRPLPVHPRLGRLLSKATARAAASGRPWRRRCSPSATRSRADAGRRTPTPTPSDVLDRVEALEAFERTGGSTRRRGRCTAAAARFVLRAATSSRLSRQRRDGRGSRGRPTPAARRRRSARPAWPRSPTGSRRRREPGSPRGVMVGGRGREARPVERRHRGRAVRLRRRRCRAGRNAGPAGVGRRARLAARRTACRDAIEVTFDEAAERVVGPQADRGSRTWSSTRRPAHAPDDDEVAARAGRGRRCATLRPGAAAAGLAGRAASARGSAACGPGCRS